MPTLQHYIDATNTFCSLTPRERRRQLPQIEATIAELMDLTFEADDGDTKQLLASLELRLRALREAVLRVEGNRVDCNLNASFVICALSTLYLLLFILPRVFVNCSKNWRPASGIAGTSSCFRYEASSTKGTPQRNRT